MAWIIKKLIAWNEKHTDLACRKAAYGLPWYTFARDVPNWLTHS